MKKMSLYVTLTIGALISLFPFYWAFIGATNESGKLFFKAAFICSRDKIG
ncbi:MAG: hypothetical protein KatS3mg080_0696 [Anoxybacillus sp.]|nr:MAG: hypothetical protein KatS3mg080_0696 [Anoxybacillus sp.]